MIAKSSLKQVARPFTTTTTTATNNQSQERSPQNHQRKISKGVISVNKPHPSISTSNVKKVASTAAVNTVASSFKATNTTAQKKHKFTNNNYQDAIEMPKTVAPSTPILNYTKGRKSPIKIQTPACARNLMKNVQNTFNEHMLKFNEHNPPQTRQGAIQFQNYMYQSKLTSSAQEQYYKSVKNPVMQKSPGRTGNSSTFSPTKKIAQQLASNSDLEQLFTRNNTEEEEINKQNFLSPQSRCLDSVVPLKSAGVYETNPQKRIRNPSEIEELQRQLHGRIQNVQTVIAKAEQAQSSRKRSNSNQKRYKGGCVNGEGNSDSSCSQSQHKDSKSFKITDNLNYHEVYQQRIQEMQSVQKNKQTDINRQIYDQTPEFRRATQDQRTTSPMKQIQKPTQKSNEGIVIYSDNEDEDSVLNILNNAPLQGTLSIIDASMNPNLMEGEAAFNSQLPQVSDSKSRILPPELSSRVIAEPFKEQQINQKQQPPQILDVITVIEDTVESTHRRNISDQENRIKPYTSAYSFNKEECLRQMRILEDKLEKIHLQNLDLNAQNTKLIKKNDTLTQKYEQTKHKKKYYKNQVQSQNQLLKEQMAQLRYMQSEHTSYRAKIENQEAQINRLNAMLSQKSVL